VFVAGGNSNTGSATVRPRAASTAPLLVYSRHRVVCLRLCAQIQSLLKWHPTVTIKAGVRDEKKAAEKFPGVDAKQLSFVNHDVKDGKLSAENVADLKGSDTLVLVPPQVYQDRVGVVSAYIAAAKEAGVKHIVFMSTPVAKEEKMILGKELHANEIALKACGIPVTYLHLVMFYENHWSVAVVFGWHVFVSSDLSLIS
jgi:uncharacterized protein YbjT (DUF2867 family)